MGVILLHGNDQQGSLLGSSNSPKGLLKQGILIVGSNHYRLGKFHLTYFH
jgi:hypothetical protein